MRRPALVLVMAAAILLAGCVDGGNAPLDPTSDGSTTTGTDATPGNETAPSEPDGPAETPSNDTQPEDPDDSNATDPRPEDPSAPVPEPEWPPIEDATIRPGVQVSAGGSQCTSNFIFTTPDHRVVMIGIAAHCVADGPSNDVNGCSDANEPADMGTQARIEGASKPGVLVYSSWATMQANGEDDPDTCAGNDFALVAIHPDDHDKVHPAMLHFGGPTGLADTASLGTGDKVLTYGNSGLRPGIEPTNWHEGYVVTRAGDWTTWTYTAGPGIPGDSGSGVLTGDGKALGVLSTLNLLPTPGSNGVANLDKAVAYAAANGVAVELATWDVLDAGLLP